HRACAGDDRQLLRPGHRVLRVRSVQTKKKRSIRGTESSGAKRNGIIRALCFGCAGPGCRMSSAMDSRSCVPLAFFSAALGHFLHCGCSSATAMDANSVPVTMSHVSFAVVLPLVALCVLPSSLFCLFSLCRLGSVFPFRHQVQGRDF